MLTSTFPKTGLHVSKLSLGTMMFGGQTDEAESLRIMAYAIDHGVNFIDTANVYNQGVSEMIVGKGIAAHRDKIILATKVSGPMGDDPNDRGLSRHNIANALNASLSRLNTDYIDVYYMHMPDYATGLEESLEAMNALVKTGKVRYIGVSNYAAWQMADIEAICDKRGYVQPIVTQNVYNLINRGIEAELIPFVKAHGIGMTVYNPIAGGLLAGKHKAGAPAENTRFANNPTYFRRYWSQENFDAVERLCAIAADHGMSILELAMKWCAAQQSVTSIISGVSRLSQIEQNIKALQGQAVDEQILAKCDDVWHCLSGTRFQYNR